MQPEKTSNDEFSEFQSPAESRFEQQISRREQTSQPKEEKSTHDEFAKFQSTELDVCNKKSFVIQTHIENVMIDPVDNFAFSPHK